MPEVKARLPCVIGAADRLISAKNRESVVAALRKDDPTRRRLRFVV
ncbi:hypothetical protein [Synechococcus sp. MU1643]|nr:hypothetical protein [Synechococcus sp. MU1643]